MAVSKMNMDQADQAIRILEDEALPINPENDLVQGYLGMAYYLANNKTKAQQIFEEIVTNDRNDEAVRMAQQLLTEWNQ